MLVKFTYQGNIFYKNIIINNLPIEDIDSDKVNNEVKDEFSTLDEIKVKTNDNTIFNKARNRNQLNEESNSNKLINNPKNSILDKNETINSINVNYKWTKYIYLLLLLFILIIIILCKYGKNIHKKKI